eukprot:gene12293-14411_t
MFRATVSGCKQGSTELYFCPRISPLAIKDDDVDADTGTAGSVTLLIQVSLPCLLFAPQSMRMILGGGTNVDFCPLADYLVNVFNPIAKRLGVDCDMEIEKRGFYPKGGGKMTVITRPMKEPLQPIVMLDKGNLTGIKIVVNFTSTRIGLQVADRIMHAARKMIKRDYKKVPIEEVIYDTAKFTFGDGTSIFITATTDTGCIYGASANGAIGVPAETVGENAANSLLSDLQHGGCVDEYLQDQLIIFMALAKGKSQIKSGPLSMHSQTSIHFTTLMTGAKFTVEPVLDKLQGEDTYLITCEGVGYFPTAASTTPTVQSVASNDNLG